MSELEKPIQDLPDHTDHEWLQNYEEREEEEVRKWFECMKEGCKFEKYEYYSIDLETGEEKLTYDHISYKNYCAACGIHSSDCTDWHDNWDYFADTSKLFVCKHCKRIVNEEKSSSCPVCKEVSTETKDYYRCNHDKCDNCKRLAHGEVFKEKDSNETISICFDCGSEFPELEEGQ